MIKRISYIKTSGYNKRSETANTKNIFLKRSFQNLLEHFIQPEYSTFFYQTEAWPLRRQKSKKIEQNKNNAEAEKNLFFLFY